MKCDELKPIELECNMGKDINGVEHREPWKAYDIDEVDAAIAELKQKLHDAEMRADLAEAAETERKIDYDKLNAENRKQKRSLWIARANSADGQFIYWCARFGVESGFTKADIRGYSVNTKRRLRMIREWLEVWKNVRSKCLKKAEEYK